MAKFPEINWGAADIAEEFKLFKQRMELSFRDKDITDPARRAVKIQLSELKASRR